MKRKPIIVCTISLFIIISFVGGIIIGSKNRQHLAVPVEFRVNTTPQYSLINPLIFIDTDQRLYPEFNALDTNISSYVQSQVSSGNANSVSVYVRDMNSGHWTGTNENETYEPSSMLKVVVMISYLRATIQDKDILSKKLYYSGDDSAEQYYKPASTTPAGYYTVQQLIDRMITQSDNVAALALISNNQDQFQSTYDDFRLPATPNGQVSDYMTAKSYSVIFRSLYNASYLLRSTSESALELLTKTNFNQGIVAGVPKGMIVAHKFGEHDYTLSDGSVVSRELHDCGIVYYPNHPYLLCIMTKGQEFPQLESVLSHISALVYSYMDAVAKK